MKSLRKLCTGALGAVVCATSIAVPLAAASPAAAGPPAGPVSCTPEPGYDNCLRFDLTGDNQTFTVPAGTVAVRAKLWGGAGGGGAPQAVATPAPGGGGGYTTGTIAVTSGQNLALTVGQGGSVSDTSNVFLGGGSGGQGSADSTTGAAGGGMSAIWSDSALGTPVLIAGGGGGAGGNSAALTGTFNTPPSGGGGGGTRGDDHDSNESGGGGTQVSGGYAAGFSGIGCNTDAGAGSQFQGGSGGGGGSYDSLGGGGGGGGYYGGGGGSCREDALGIGSGGAGGGGSAFIAPEGVFNASTAMGNTSSSTDTAYPAGTSDPLYSGIIGTSDGGSDGRPGEIVLEWDGSPVAPTPENATSTGIGTAAQSPDITAPAGGTVRLVDSNDAPVTSLDVSGEGTYTVDTTTNVITFAPIDGFKGDATPVKFRETNTSLQTGDATYTAHVDAPPGPTPDPLISSGTGTATQTATATIPTGGSVTLLDGLTPTNSITTDGQGTYTLDPTTGIISFEPVLGFSGAASPITYQVSDNYGTPGTSTYTPTVDKPAAPTPADLGSIGTGTATQTATAVIPDGGSVTLLDGLTPTTTIVAPGEGTYTLNTDTGVITFAPVLGFSGGTTGITYQVTDAYGSTGTATYDPGVWKPQAPFAGPLTSSRGDALTQYQHVNVPTGGLVVFRNFAPGIHIQSIPGITTVVIPGKGTYTVNSETGGMAFTPVANFIGPVPPVTYRVYDAYSQHADGTYTATVTPYGTARASAPALVTLTTKYTALPVMCTLTAGYIHRCDVALTYAKGGHIYAVGSGTAIVSGAGSTQPVKVVVRPNALGRYLAGAMGGVPATVAINVTQVANPRLVPARTVTRFVNARIATPRAVHFLSTSSSILPTEAAYLNGLRSKLAGVKTITCAGNTESGTGSLASWMLGYARARNVCNFLTQGTKIGRVFVSYGNSRPIANNSTPDGRAQNRRVDVELEY